MTDKDVQPRTTPYWRPSPPSANLARQTCAWLLGLGMLAVIVFSVVSGNGLGEYMRLRGQRDDLQRDVNEMQAEAARLEASIEALRSNPLALETLARERYNMRREGEQVILLVPDAAGEPSDP